MSYETPGTPQNPYQGPPQGPPPGPQQGSPRPEGGTTLATTALILGIVTVVLAFVPVLNLLAVFIGIAALVVGLIAVNRARSLGKGKALAGAILGGVGTLLAIVLAVVYTVIGVSALIESVESDRPTVISSPPLLVSPTPPPGLSPTDGPLDPDPAPGAVAERQVFTGEGADVVAIDLAGRAGVVTFDCPECEGSTVLSSDGSDSVLVEVEGPWNGQYLIDAVGEPTTELSVTTTGFWSIVVDDVSSVAPSTGAASGTGDRVVRFTEGFEEAAVTHDGAGLFALVAYATGYPADALDTTDDVDEVIDLAGPGFVQVFADGEWSITPVDPVLP